MGIRPAKCYRDLKQRAYTRTAVKVHRRNYIGATPGLRTRQFNMGNGAANFDTVLDVRIKEGRQIRDNAIEAARIMVTKALTDKLKKEGFFIKVRVYPHNILRENKQAQGAGADRVSTGMSHSFGTVVGRSARVKKGQIVFSVLCWKKDTNFVKKILEKTKHRFGVPVDVLVHNDVESIGTKPSKIKLTKSEKEELKKAEEGKEEGEKKEGKGKEGDKKGEGKGKEAGKKEEKKDDKKKK